MGLAASVPRRGSDLPLHISKASPAPSYLLAHHQNAPQMSLLGSEHPVTGGVQACKHKLHGSEDLLVRRFYY